MATLVSDTYEWYLLILWGVDKCVRGSLGWDTPNWRVNNACRACCYKVSPRSLVLPSHVLLTTMLVR